MKILEETSIKLVLQTPQCTSVLWIIMGLFFGGIIILFGTFSLFIYSGIEELTCQRIEPTQVNCELTSSRYMGLKQMQKILLSQVRGARVKEVTDTEGGTSHEITILTQSREVVLFNTNPDDASRLNDFVKNPETTSLTIKYDNRWAFIWRFPFLRLCIFTCFGTMSLFIYDVTAVDTYTFDKTFGQLTENLKTLLETKINKYSFQEIIDVHVEKKIDGDGDLIGYSVSLRLTADKRITFPSLSQEEARKLAKTIAQFLNIPESR